MSIDQEQEACVKELRRAARHLESMAIDMHQGRVPDLNYKDVGRCAHITLIVEATAEFYELDLD